MGRVIDSLDKSKRCSICRRFYWKPKGKSEQLPLHPTAWGDSCQACISAVLWKDFGEFAHRPNGTDPVAYLKEPAD